VELVRRTKMLGRLPVVNFAAGGVATPADAALMMQVQLLPPASLHRMLLA
jgi:pyridoxal 5'-phosphate synthase pdxS subunit